MSSNESMPKRVQLPQARTVPPASGRPSPAQLLAGTSRNELTKDDVLLKPSSGSDFAFNAASVRTFVVSEGGCRQPRVGCKRRLGNGPSAPAGPEAGLPPSAMAALIGLLELGNIHELARQQRGRTGPAEP